MVVQQRWRHPSHRPADPGGQTSRELSSSRNIGLDAGSFFNKYITPIVTDIQKIIDRLQPVLNFLNTPVPILGDHGFIQDFFFHDKSKTITIADVVELLDPA